MAAPMFSIATLFSSAAGGIDDALNEIEIPDLSDAIDLGPFDFIGDALDDVVDLLEGILRGLLYILLIVFFDQFINGIKAQFLGSFTSASGLVRCVCVLAPNCEIHFKACLANMGSWGIICDS